MALEEVHTHMVNIGRYRENVMLADKIREIRLSNMTKRQQGQLIWGIRKEARPGLEPLDNTT
jgi:hypothetical protein